VRGETENSSANNYFCSRNMGNICRDSSSFWLYFLLPLSVYTINRVNSVP